MGQLEDAPSDAVSEISALKSAHERQIAEVMSELRALKARLAYYENPHSPPSADSLEWRRAKKEKKNMAAKSERKPGGQPGRRGASRAMPQRGAGRTGLKAGRRAQGEAAPPGWQEARDARHSRDPHHCN